MATNNAALLVEIRLVMQMSDREITAFGKARQLWAIRAEATNPSVKTLAERKIASLNLTPGELLSVVRDDVSFACIEEAARVVAEAAAEAARPVPQLDGRHDWCGFC